MEYICSGLTIGLVWMPFFNIGLHISPALVGLLLMLFRAWDAFSDPVMGNISDNARTRWGRRRPFMFVGAILTGCLFPWLWHLPAGWSEMGMFFYLLVLGVLFFTSYTCFSMPYHGMQMELTPNYDERTRLTAWLSFFSKLAALGGGWVMAIITGPWFANSQTGEPDIVHGMRSISWLLAALIIVFGLMPALFVKERFYKKEASTQPRDPFWQSIRESLSCGPLWCLIGASFFLVLGNSSVISLGQYVNIYMINSGKLADASVIDGWKYTTMMVVGIGTIPLWTWLSERLDKKTLVIGLLVLAMIGHLLYYYCLNPEMPYLQLIPAAMQAGATGAVWLFLPSMKADVADYDEISTARRREGALNAFYSWFIKAAHTCALGVGGLVLSLSGFDVLLESQLPETLRRMTVIYIWLPVFIWALAIACMMAYPITRGRMRSIRDQLETRRGKL